jgi:hypothetical protein
VAPGDVAMVSLSTTLATNALVEGQGGRVALVFIGFDAGDLGARGPGRGDGRRSGDPPCGRAQPCGHRGGAAGSRRPLEARVAEVAPVSWALPWPRALPPATPRMRSPRARDPRATGRPVTCSHELSASLNGPKRALTAVLNARLIGMIDRLVSACERHLRGSASRRP